MRHKLFKIVPIAVAMIVGAPFLAPQSWGDIIKTSELRTAPRSLQQAGENVGPEAPLRLQCWQFGREIIDQSDLHSMSLKPLLEQDSVSFKRKGTKGAAVHIVSVDDTVCMVQATP